MSVWKRLALTIVLVSATGYLGMVKPAAADGVINASFIGGAIKGYDPVAYFTLGEPTEGSSEFTFDWMGATWQFSSAANKAKFAASPQRYAPQFGGYCAWAVSQGYTAGITPDAWHIADGKLYLNYSKNVQKQWAADIPGNIAKGIANWPKIKAELSE